MLSAPFLALCPIIKSIEKAHGGRARAQAQMMHRMGNGAPPASPDGAGLMLRVPSGALGPALGPRQLSGVPSLGSPQAVGTLSPEAAGVLRMPGGSGGSGGSGRGVPGGPPGGPPGVDAATTAAMLRTMSPTAAAGAQRTLSIGAMGGLV